MNRYTYYCWKFGSTATYEYHTMIEVHEYTGVSIDKIRYAANTNHPVDGWIIKKEKIKINKRA